MNLEYKKDTLSLSQVHSKGVKFSLFDDKLNALHQPVFCKDYLNDVLWFEHTGRYSDSKVYGFVYEENKSYKIKDSDTVHLAIFHTEKNICDEETRNTIEKCLNGFEQLLKFKPTSCDLYDNGIMLNFSNEWVKYPYLLSLYTLLVRCSLTYKGEPIVDFIEKYNQNDDNTTMIKSARKKIYAMFEGIFPVSNYTDYKGVYDAHGLSGIVSTKAKFEKEVVNG